MRIRPVCFRGGQHDGLRHDGGRLTPLVGGARSQLLLGTTSSFHATAGIHTQRLSHELPGRSLETDRQAYQRRARPGDSTGVGGVPPHLSRSRNTDIR